MQQNLLEGLFISHFKHSKLKYAYVNVKDQQRYFEKDNMKVLFCHFVFLPYEMHSF